MRPDTLPPSFYNFILRTGPIDSRVLQAVRNNCRGKPFDAESVSCYLSKAAPNVDHSSVLANTLPAVVPCGILHPGHEHCTTNSLNVFFDSFRKVFPLYWSALCSSALSIVLRVVALTVCSSPARCRSCRSW